MSFFKDMSLERVFILLSLIGSIALLYMGIGTYKEHEELEEALKTKVSKVSNQIQQSSRTHTRLFRDKEGDEFLRQESPVSYIRFCADTRGAEIGQISVAPSKTPLGNGLEDHTFRITTQEYGTTFPRERIAMFLYELEKGSEQMRVTSLEIRTSNKPKVEDHQIPANAWTLKATCTSRQKADDS
jgi:hypothetical protein